MEVVGSMRLITFLLYLEQSMVVFNSGVGEEINFKSNSISVLCWVGWSWIGNQVRGIDLKLWISKNLKIMI